MLASRTARLAVLGVLVLVLVAGLVLSTMPAPRGDGVSAGASARPSAAPTTPVSPPPSLPTERRPLTDVPDVTPAGFVDAPPGSGLQRYRDQDVTWRTCAERFQCATVAAPLDYDEPDGQALTLALARRPATEQPSLGTLFINPGGPGGPGRNYVTYFRSEGLERYDVVGWDPRGVAGSTPVQCLDGPGYDRYFSIDLSPDDAAEEEALRQEQYAFGQVCLQRSGALLEHVSTEETVRDLDLLRGLVGDERLSYFGASYGTRIGALYAQLFPDRVGRMVLDGAVNITGQPVSQLEGFERALGHFSAWAAEPREGEQPLGGTREEVLASVQRLLTDLDQQPLAVGERQLSQQQGVQAVVDSLYGRSDWSALRQALTGATRGDGTALLALADQGSFRSSDGSYAQLNAAFPAIRCRDSQDVSVAEAERDERRLARRAPVLGPLSGADLVCPLWPVGPAPEQPRITAKGAAPILVLGTTGDPATPYENAVGMAEQLDSGVLLTLEGEGHTAYSQSECVRGLVDAYLNDGAVPADGTRCAS